MVVGNVKLTPSDTVIVDSGEAAIDEPDVSPADNGLPGGALNTWGWSCRAFRPSVQEELDGLLFSIGRGIGVMMKNGLPSICEVS